MSTNLKAARDTYVATLRRIVTEKEATVRSAVAEFETAKAELAAVTGGEAPSQRKAASKPGPKAGRKAKKTATPKKVKPQKTPDSKPAKKAKKTATKKVKPQKSEKTATPKRKATAAAIESAAQGRRAVAAGLRPPLKEALAILLGTKSMNIEDAIKGLHAKGWMPASKNEHSYISYALSSNKDMFERVSRGEYKVRAGTSIDPKWKKDTKIVTAKTVTKVSAPKVSTKKVTTSEEQKLQDLGVGVASNPFMS